MRAHESRAPTRPTSTIPASRSPDRPLGDGVTLDRDRRRHDSRGRARVDAFNAGITEIDTEIAAETAEIGATITITNTVIPITTVIANRGIAARKD